MEPGNVLELGHANQMPIELEPHFDPISCSLSLSLLTSLMYRYPDSNRPGEITQPELNTYRHGFHLLLSALMLMDVSDPVVGRLQLPYITDKTLDVNFFFI